MDARAEMNEAMRELAREVVYDYRTKDPSALGQFTAQLEPWLEDSEVTEICINRPGRLFVERSKGWSQEAVEFASYDWCQQFSRLVAGATKQRVNSESPLLSASLPSGERVQVVLPPAAERGTVAIVIRRPSDRVWGLGELASAGAFERCASSRTVTDEDQEQELERLYAAGDWREFLALAVRARKNIVVSGATGSGKTTLTKALITEIPFDERLIVLEDAAELALGSHPNSVRLLYSKDAQGLARVSAKQLLEASLRMRPDRILLAELRGEEAYYYLRNVNSGHPGSITSVHASSAELAFEQLTLLVKESPAGREMARDDIRSLLHELVDVVVQCGRDQRGRRVVTEILYRGADARGRSGGGS